MSATDPTPAECRWSEARSRWETVIRPGVSAEACPHPAHPRVVPPAVPGTGDERVHVTSDGLRWTLSRAPDAGDVDVLARILMAAWESAENRPVNVSYFATHADMARAVLTSDWLAAHDAEVRRHVADELDAMVRPLLQGLKRPSQIYGLVAALGAFIKNLRD